jgi:large subunit ribosomal protein L24e
MPKCSFCGEQYEIPRGLTYVKADGKIFFLCSSKCRKNLLNLGRTSKKVKWIVKSDTFKKEAAAKQVGKEKAAADKVAEQTAKDEKIAAKREARKEEKKKNEGK